jgi:hypothetical protein
MDKIEELGQWLLSNQSNKDSPEFQDKLSEYRLLRFQQKYQEASQLPDGDRKAMILDRLRTEISNAGGTPELTKGPLVTQTPSNQQDGEYQEVPIDKGAPKTLLPQERDVSGATPANRMVYGGVGAGAGAAASSAGMANQFLLDRAKKKAEQQEAGRINAQRTAGVAPTGSGPIAGSGPIDLGGGMTLEQSPSRAVVPFGGPDGGRMAPGTTGNMQYNYGKSAGLTDIEAGRALDMTKNEGGVHDLSTKRREGLNKVGEIAPGFRENPQFGGLMTDQSVGSGPRQSFVQQAPTPTPEMPGPGFTPPGELRAVDVQPRLANAKKSGLDLVTDLYKSFINSPTAELAGRVMKRVAPPLAALGAGLDAAELEHEMRKEAEDQDRIKMALKFAGLTGGALSLIPHPATIAISSGLGLGASGLEYLYDRNRPVRPPKYGYGQNDITGYSARDLGFR